jgi:hypothetical protein
MKRLMVTSSVMLTLMFLNVMARGRSCDSSGCVAQEYRSHAYVGAGVVFVNPDKFNTVLSANGLSAFSSRSPTVTLGIQTSLRRVVWEKEISFSGWQHNLDSNTRSDLSAAGLLWNTGFNFLPREQPIALMPFVGAGLGLNAMHIRSETKSISGILSANEPNARMWQATLVLNAGLGADYTITSPDRSKGIIIGLRAGYLFDPIKNKSWWSDGIRVTDLSALSRNGAYARVVIGGWKHHEKTCGHADKGCPMHGAAPSSDSAL